MENLRTLPSLARRALRRFLLLVLALQAGALLAGLPAQVPVARAQAAGTTEPSARPVPPFLQPLLPARPRMVVAEARLPIQVVRVRVDAEIVGMAARTRIEMEFRNPNERVLEGELQFPLRPGQAVTGFALDIDGELRPAVPVEKARGRQVFDDVIRARVDPALLEVTEGNNYRLRVYPLPANGTRRVVLEIGESLARTTERGQVRLDYQLPLQFGQPIGRLEADLRFPGTEARMVSASLGAERLMASAGPDGSARLVVERSAAVDPQLRVQVPAAGNRAQVSTASFAGDTFLYAEIPLAAASRARAAPAEIAIVWDASGSGANRDHGRELAVLDGYFRALGSVTVQLIQVRDVALPAERFEVSGGDWRALRSALEKMVYDGATNLGAIAIPASARLALLFSDGLGNYGPDPMPAAQVPMYVLTASTAADPVALRHRAEQSGGALIDLQRTATADAVRELRTQRSRAIAARADGATDLVQASVYPEDGRIVVAGRMLAPAATIELEIVAPDGARTTRRIEVSGSAARPAGAGGPSGSLAAQRWAALRLAALQADAERNRSEIRRLGMRFSMPTPETSLIVLDAVADYARYGIEPPPALRAAYERLVARQRDADLLARSRQLDRIAARFAEKQSWWERVFPKDEPPKPVPKAVPAPAGAAVGSAADSARRSEQRPAPPAPPAPTSAARANAVPAPVAMASSAAEATTGNATAAPQTSIRLARWVPDAPYVKRLRAAPDSALYEIYLDERPSYLASTAFFLDVADILFERGQPALANRVLSNLAEMNLENRHILRILGYRLLQARQVALALPVLRKVLLLSPDEPQSYRDLGLALAQAGQAQQAVDHLWQVVERPWNNRVPDIELIALAELNAIIARTVAAGGPALDTRAIDPRLLRNLPLDLRVVLSWDADNTDIDLWVIDPNGERAFYGRRLTYQGGRMSNDFTGGYGPEEFSLRTAKPGTYTVKAQFYGHNQQIVAPATTLMMRLSTGFGTATQKDEDIVLRLSGSGQEVSVGTFTVGSPDTR
ncbi:MAG: VIT domain-containing protein [bacterium]